MSNTDNISQRKSPTSVSHKEDPISPLFPNNNDIELRLCENMNFKSDIDSNLWDGADDVKFIASDGMPSFFTKKRCVYLIGTKETLINQVYDAHIQTVLKKWNYDIAIHNSVGKFQLSDYIGGDIVCPLFDVDSKIRGYVITDIAGLPLESTLDKVLKSVTRYEREYLEELIITAAFNAPADFVKSVEEAFGEEKDSDEGNDRSNRILPFGISGIPILPLGAAAFGIDACIDFGDVEGLDDVSGDSIDLSESSLSKSRYLNSSNLSSKNKREFLKQLPEKVSERFIKKNPNCKVDLLTLIASVSHEDLQEICLHLITKAKRATDIFDFSNLGAASEYELHVKKWNKSITGFDYKFQYCVVLKDRDNHEYPIKFHHHPAYCLYIMYLIDRAQRGDNATYLSIQANKAEFIRLYGKVFGCPYEEAEKKYLTFSYRLTKEGERTRKGRYDDYLKDIDETITSIVGRADSIPLKLRDGGHIELLPERIKIDQDLLDFKFH